MASFEFKRDAAFAQNLDELERLGFTVVKDIFNIEEIERMKRDYEEVIKPRAHELVTTTEAHDRVWTENDTETRSRYWKGHDAVSGKIQLILQAGEGRYDLYKGFDQGFFASETVVNNAKIEGIVKELLVDDYSSYSGVIQSDPQSSDQYWHRDTSNLTNRGTDGSKLVLMDDFYITCLIPILEDVTVENGATEFMVGSHRVAAGRFPELSLAQASVPLGSALLFNGKCNHRGKANESPRPRPVIYSVYHKTWYNDNFRKGVVE